MAVAAACAVLGACQGEGTPPTPTPAVQAYCGDDAVAVERRIDGLLKQLTLEEKTGLTRGGFLDGGLWLAPGLAARGIPPLHLIDGPRGVSAIAGNATAFPVGMARGATFDPELEQRIGERIGLETRAVGGSVILAPTMNVLRHPRWGRSQETYGEDPFHLGAMATAFVAGAQRHVLATAKHYAANSIEDTRVTVDVTVDERTLREVYLPHFRRVVREGQVGSVMTAYNSVNGAFCSQSPHLVREILKGEWEFAGFAVSDWLWGMHDTVAAAHAGLDLEMPVESVYGASLRAAVEAGEVDEATVDEMVRRLLRPRFCRRLDVDPPVPDPAALETAEAYALAQEVAERSMVLLANPAGLLPLDRAALAAIVVTGPLADVENLGDTGSSNVAPTSVVTALAGIAAAAGPVVVTHLPAPPASTEDQAAIAAADAVVVVVGLTSRDEGEGQIGAGDRNSLALPEGQAQWILDVAALSDRVVVVVEGGGALTMDDFLGQVEAVLLAWYPGVRGGAALARVLFGEVNPSGRLPLSFPRADADLPPFDNAAPSVTYGYFHGYRHLDHEGIAPLFPFGFGLAYTGYARANLRLEGATLRAGDVLRATVDVTNTGSRAGRETVQLYVGAVASTVTPRSVRELRGFAQVELQPGETKPVTLEVPVDDLAFYDAAAGGFRVAPGTYLVEVGSSSRDLPLAAEVTVAP
ncbi:MAG: glycoside hydrolase family 3 C-terminal domain-containing protein [Deltaproteobacteria bacterium]|nr:glycoside hydrolase family 3 C-terminal domain-containing protein [Deltaproteobacteria bacterium]